MPRRKSTLSPLERSIASEALRLNRQGQKTFLINDFKQYCKGDHSRPCHHPSVRNAISRLAKKGFFSRVRKGIYKINPEFTLPVQHREGLARIDLGSSENHEATMIQYLLSLKKAVDEGKARFEFHDVNLLLRCDGLYNCFKNSPLVPYHWRYDWRLDEKLQMWVGNKKFISGEYKVSKNRYVKFAVGPQDTVEVFVRSSEEPFAFSDKGMLDLHAVLVEARTILLGSVEGIFSVPEASDWVIVQWQRHVDSPEEVSGPRCNMRFADFAKTVGRFYVKEFATGEVRARAESIEPVGKSVYQVHQELMEKDSPFVSERIKVLSGRIDAVGSEFQEVRNSLKELAETSSLLAENIKSHVAVIKEMADRRELERQTLQEHSEMIARQKEVITNLSTVVSQLTDVVNKFARTTTSQFEALDKRQEKLEEISERTAEILQRITRKKGILRRIKEYIW